MQNKTGGTAFPHITFDQGCDGHGLHFTNPDNPGMTLRQYYKAKVAAAVYTDLATRPGFTPEYLAKTVGDMADALIAEDEAFEKRGGDDA